MTLSDICNVIIYERLFDEICQILHEKMHKGEFVRKGEIQQS